MKIEAEWMRGGTSKCWVFETEHLQKTGAGLEELKPRLLGSTDSRQIDGVGGATSTTSKAVILHRAAADDEADVEFTFAQVGIEEATVDWGSNCGNCSAVVGLYALEKGWVVPTGEMTRIVTRNTNTGQIIVQRVPPRTAASRPSRTPTCLECLSPATGSGWDSRTRPAGRRGSCCPLVRRPTRSPPPAPR